MTKAIVFGASGDLGRQLCTKLIDRGFQVTGVTRDVQAKTFQNSFSTELQSGALSLDMVVGSYLNYEFTNPVDLIIFCQALFQPSPLTALSTSDVFSEIEVGLIGPMILTKEYLQQFSPDDHGRLDVCYIGSTSAYAGARDTATYCTVKHGLKGFVRALNEEYKCTDYRFCLVSMGTMQTKMGRKIEGQDPHTYLDPERVADKISSLLTSDSNLFEPEIIIRRRHIGLI